MQKTSLQPLKVILISCLVASNALSPTGVFANPPDHPTSDKPNNGLTRVQQREPGQERSLTVRVQTHHTPCQSCDGEGEKKTTSQCVMSNVKPFAFAAGAVAAAGLFVGFFSYLKHTSGPKQKLVDRDLAPAS